MNEWMILLFGTENVSVCSVLCVCVCCLSLSLTFISASSLFFFYFFGSIDFGIDIVSDYVGKVQIKKKRKEKRNNISIWKLSTRLVWISIHILWNIMYFDSCCYCWSRETLSLKIRIRMRHIFFIFEKKNQKFQNI